MNHPHPLKRPTRSRLRRIARAALVSIAALGVASPVFAFCGFYVAKAETDLFNRASRVAIVRSGERTVVTMANDYEGDLDAFGIVIPVPTFLEREQIHVAEPALLDRLDAFTAPRLVEYFDDSPCNVYRLREELS
ncbi:MAG: DUF2330 domain-containing protein, partial [Planctomycetota bacterium]|nr:DUF2330 domain-containing protein [Planctomycetota bacterium]